MSGAYFQMTEPAGAERPVLVEVPHAGLDVPQQVLAQLAVPDEARMRDADIFVDRLYADAPAQGAALLVARASRYVVDLNRAADDVDRATVYDHPSPMPVQPRGVVWRATTDGRPVLTRPLSYASLCERLRVFYDPYHAAVRERLYQLRRTHGFAILLAAHSMPSMGRSGHADPGSRRADVVPGTQGRSTCDERVIDLVDAHFRAAGLSVAHDDPYKGGYATVHYGRPTDRLHAIQIELNRALYVNEKTFEPRAGNFERLQALLAELVGKLGDLDLR